MSATWEEAQIRCLSEIALHQGANKSYIDDGVRLLELARNARNLFEKQEPRESGAFSIFWFRTAVGRPAS